VGVHQAVNANGFITAETAILWAMKLLVDADDPAELPRLAQQDLCLRADCWTRVAAILVQTGPQHLGPHLSSPPLPESATSDTERVSA
jgi:hypothetical protein